MLLKVRDPNYSPVQVITNSRNTLFRFSGRQKLAICSRPRSSSLPLRSEASFSFWSEGSLVFVAKQESAYDVALPLLMLLTSHVTRVPRLVPGAGETCFRLVSRNNEALSATPTAVRPIAARDSASPEPDRRCLRLFNNEKRRVPRALLRSNELTNRSEDTRAPWRRLNIDKASGKGVAGSANAIISD